MTTRVWDLRYPSASLALLRAHIGAIRSLRFRCHPPPGFALCLGEGDGGVGGNGSRGRQSSEHHISRLRVPLFQCRRPVPCGSRAR